MKRIGEIFSGNRTEEKLLKRKKRDDRLFSSWQKVAGDACGAHTVRVTLKNGVLYVYLDSQTWRQELMLQDTKMLAENMEKHTGYTIAHIKVRTGGNRSI